MAQDDNDKLPQGKADMWVEGVEPAPDAAPKQAPKQYKPTAQPLQNMPKQGVARKRLTKT
jgi:hypothetical protein